LKSTETRRKRRLADGALYFSNFGSLKSTETPFFSFGTTALVRFQQFRLVEEH